MEVVLKFILVIFIMGVLYSLIQKYAKRRNKDLFLYRIYCRSYYIFYNYNYI